MNLPFFDKTKQQLKVGLNRKLYNAKIVDQFLSGESPSVRRLRTDKERVYIAFNTKEIKKALELLNYLLYLHKAHN